MSPKRIERTECEIYSRVTGWIVPRSAMNKGKLAERFDMRTYKIDEKKL